MTNTAVIQEIADDKMLITGKLNFDSVTALCPVIKTSMPAPNVTIDLAGVEYSDSTGLALLTEWLRQAKQQSKKIIFINPPQQMQAIAKVCGLQTILGF